MATLAIGAPSHTRHDAAVRWEVAVDAPGLPDRSTSNINIKHYGRGRFVGNVTQVSLGQSQ